MQHIRSLGKQVGISLNPSTPETAIEYVLDRVDLILVMSVNPGFGGQSYIHAVTEKIRRLRRMIGSRNIRLQVDGGVHKGTLTEVVQAGADTIVAGSAVFKNGTYAENISELRHLASQARL